MKKQISISLILFASILTVNAQIFTPSGTIQGSSGNNNIGIGNPSPSWQLTVKDIIAINGTNDQRLYIRPNSGYAGFISWAEGEIANRGILGFNYGSGDLVYRSGATNFSNGTERFKIDANGNMFTHGKTTYLWGANSTEYQALMFAGWGYAHGGLFWKGIDKTFTMGTGDSQDNFGQYGSANLLVTGDITTASKTTYLWGANGNEYQALMFAGKGYANGGLFWKGIDKTFTISTGENQDNIGIYGNANLNVDGKITAHEIKVCITQGCDFVFKSDYSLMDLKELEKFVRTKQHLPEIAPEKEMVENGVNMKELQMKLLQKIEELTLYTIEQNKQIEELKKQSQELKALKEDIEKLKADSK